MSDRTKRIPLALLLLCSAAAAPPLAKIRVSDGWFAMQPNRPLAGFFSITNDGDQPLLMTGWQSPACRSIRFVEASSGSGENPIGTITVPARETMVFAPGGYHLVCDGPSGSLRTGGSVVVSVSFRSGRTLRAPFAIRDMPSHH